MFYIVMMQADKDREKNQRLDMVRWIAGFHSMALAAAANEACFFFKKCELSVGAHGACLWCGRFGPIPPQWRIYTHAWKSPLKAEVPSWGNSTTSSAAVRGPRWPYEAWHFA
jgi:hypothetical protein